jgi:hypothetical protein
MAGPIILADIDVSGGDVASIFRVKNVHSILTLPRNMMPPSSGL